MLTALSGIALLAACCGAANAATPKLAAGYDYSVGLSADGKTYGWGSDAHGELAIGRVVEASVPQTVPDLNLGQGAGKHSLASGSEFNVALKLDGSVWTWGSNYAGQLGDGTISDHSVPAKVPGLTNVVAVAAGTWHTLAVKSDGSVWTWGRNDSGQLGDATNVPKNSPVIVSGVTDAAAISAGILHSIALTSDGNVWTWGSNELGELGDGTMNDRSFPGKVAGLSGVVAVAAHSRHNLALKSDGSVWAWGSNYSGQLGDGTTENRSVPVQVVGLKDVIALAAGDSHSLALKSDGSLWTWGFNGYGQLGDGGTNDQYTPILIGYSFREVAAGATHSLALKADGTAWSWGWNYHSQLGDGIPSYQRNSPAQIIGVTNFVALAGGGFNSLAAKSDGSVLTWGDNAYGQLGDGKLAKNSLPVLSTALNGITAISAGNMPDAAPFQTHALALNADGGVLAWGNNLFGALGDGTTTNSSTPINVHGLTGAMAVASGWDHSLAMKADGTLWSWGSNGNGALGDGTTTNHLLPAQIAGLTSVAAVAAGWQYSVALKSDGSVWAWGFPGGALQNGIVPTKVSGISNVIAVAAGAWQHILALKSDGTVWSWGLNMNGQLGDGTTNSRVIPMQVAGLANIVAVAAGERHSLAVGADGSVWSWGSNYTGQLGDGTSIDRLLPVKLAGLNNVVAIAAGNAHSLALLANGQVMAWGSNRAGQLGDGTFETRMTPVQVINRNGDGLLNLNTIGLNVIESPRSIATPITTIEFYNTTLDHYFITSDEDEAKSIDGGSAGAGWVRTGNNFKAGGKKSVCRFYGSQSPGPNSHFYTVDVTECSALKKLALATPTTQKRWNFEHINFLSTPAISGACLPGTLPVYRAYNNGFARGVDSNHRLTVSRAAIQEVVARGWIDEGVMMCAPE